MIHVLSSTGRLLLALDPDLFRARNAGDRSLLEDMPALHFFFFFLAAGTPKLGLAMEGQVNCKDGFGEFCGFDQGL